jgi:hypothetical protein
MAVGPRPGVSGHGWVPPSADQNLSWHYHEFFPVSNP